MYMVSNWIVDGINNKLYKYTNDIIEDVYQINIAKSIGEAAVAVGTDENTVAITCPTAGMVAFFDIGAKTFKKYTTVGGTPIGICEGIPYGAGDNRQPYFVANYSTDSVGIIKDGVVVQTISVGRSPRSVATDGYGRVYVANFNSATVSVLAPTDNGKYIVYKTIQVDKYPNCVAVNHNDDVFVVCQNSVFKIRKDNTKIRFSIAGSPVNISGDKYGNMWITNLANDSVIRFTMQEKFFEYVSGGSGPVYISSDKNGDVICLNTGNKTITRINEDGTVINTINLDFIPMANGDFVGYMSRINILDDMHREDDKKITFDDLDDDLKERIEHGGVDPETLILKSDNITYNHAGFSTVTEAINNLIYEKSGALSECIKKFEIDPPLAELGTHITSIKFNYKIEAYGDINLAMAEVNKGVGVIPLDGSVYTLNGLDITSDEEYKLTIYNDSLNMAEKIASIKFNKKMYYGMKNTIISSAIEILNLDNNEFIKDEDESLFNKELEFNNGNGYLYIAVPSSLGITVDDIYVNNFKDSNWETAEFNFTNASGHSEMYTLFRSGYTHNVSGYRMFVSINHYK